MSGAGREAELQNLLSVALAQAINQQDRNAAAQIRETLRCLSLLDGAGTAKLVRSLGEEFRRRLVASTRNVESCHKVQSPKSRTDDPLLILTPISNCTDS